MNNLPFKLFVKVFCYRLFLWVYLKIINAKSFFTKENKLDNIDFFKRSCSLEKNFTSSIVIYAATIGELRAANRLISCLQDKHPDCMLVLVPGQTQYMNVFSSIYPDALVMKEFPSSPGVVDSFFNKVRARLCIFIEGPSLYGYFPIRLDLSLAAGCLWHKVPLFVVNACLYEKTIGSRFELIESQIFSDILFHAITQWFVPNQKIAKTFLEHNTPKDKLLVTGDIKLDNVFMESLPPVPDELEEVFEFYNKYNCRLIVAGSVNEYDEQTALINAWSCIRKLFPDVVLVLVPRYINNQVMMNRIYEFLHAQNIPYARRSQGMADMAVDKVLIVDVFGELPYLYRYSEIAFAGKGHGVLEPMKFSKPVVVGPRRMWKQVGSTSYILFEQFLEKEALIECSDYEALVDIFGRLLSDPRYGASYVERYTKFIREQMGAVDRIIKHIDKLL